MAEAELTGLAGVATDVMDALGEIGVGVLVLSENVFPPIPSEVVLGAAGVLINEDRLSLVPVIIWATVGSVVGALVLYSIGRALGPRRSHAFLDRLPLVETEDVDKTFDWFARHGR